MSIRPAQSNSSVEEASTYLDLLERFFRFDWWEGAATRVDEAIHSLRLIFVTAGNLAILFGTPPEVTGFFWEES